MLPARRVAHNPAERHTRANVASVSRNRNHTTTQWFRPHWPRSADPFAVSHGSLHAWQVIDSHHADPVLRSERWPHAQGQRQRWQEAVGAGT